MNTQDIDALGLSSGLVFIAIAIAGSLLYSLKLEKDLLIGTLRTFAQLFLMGYILSGVFAFDLEWPVMACFVFMAVFAVWLIRGRAKEHEVHYLMPILAFMTVAYLIVTGFVSGVIVGVKPWWSPRYFITLGGMIIGNSTTAISIALERLFSDLRTRRAEVEMMLTLGADYREASADIIRNAMRAGMIPTINAMMGVGIVFIPGMMTGQILGGADPSMAIRYQIMVMLMLTGSTTLGSLVSVLIARRRSFGKAHELLIRPETTP
ncbi:MAG: iron export ABC transporter permease subunit FetB [Desulfobacteraceae bacterium]|nr:iron export ABC transporter permease subunit FetB [Desulfobacteraceae bacterium]